MESPIHSGIVMRFTGPLNRTDALRLASVLSCVARSFDVTASLVAVHPYQKNGANDGKPDPDHHNRSGPS
jgi:hypothetical protein